MSEPIINNKKMPKRQSSPIITNTEENQKKKSLDINSDELQYILDINQKATEIYLTVEQQQDQIIDQLKANNVSVENLIEIVSLQEKQFEEIKTQQESFEKENEKFYKEVKEFISKNDKRLEEMEKNLFRLTAILGTSLIGSVVAIAIAIITKK